MLPNIYYWDSAENFLQNPLSNLYNTFIGGDCYNLVRCVLSCHHCTDKFVNYYPILFNILRLLFIYRTGRKRQLRICSWLIRNSYHYYYGKRPNGLFFKPTIHYHAGTKYCFASVQFWVLMLFGKNM